MWRICAWPFGVEVVEVPCAQHREVARINLPVEGLYVVQEKGGEAFKDLRGKMLAAREKRCNRTEWLEVWM